MLRMSGMIKVSAVFAVDFILLSSLLHDMSLSAMLIGILILYAIWGGYIDLLKEGAVKCDHLPAYENSRLQSAKEQLLSDVRRASAVDLSGLKIYLIPGDTGMQATAYGNNCVSVSRGTFDNADPVTLNAVLAHEVSHTLHFDPEFNRAVFGSILFLIGAMSVISFVFIVFIFIVFVMLCFWRSWIGVLVFNGTRKAVGGFFDLLQRGVVVIYQIIMGIVGRHAEYRSDLYSCELGYGAQLSHFLSIAAPDTYRQMTITEALYRSHPPTERRIARIEYYMNVNP